MKKVLFVIVTLLNALCVKAQADYPLALAKFQRYYTAKQSDSLYSMLSANSKAVLSPEKTAGLMEALHTELGEIKSITIQSTTPAYVIYKAVFTKKTGKLILALNNNNELEGIQILPDEVKDDNVTLNGLRGTLTVPEGSNKVPVVLLLAGSGPTDRNGNAQRLGLNTNAYKMLAAGLQSNGIACLRYDKRGIDSSSAAAEANMRFDDMVKDAAAFIKMLKADPRFSKVFVLGHSEGSLIGMIAVEQEPAAGFISLAGAGERADLIIEKQLAAQSKEMAATATILLDSLAKGYTVKEPAGILKALFRTSVQPYMISWLKYDPQQEIKKLKIPVLIVQGNTDLQVSTGDAALLKKAKPDATLVEIDQMNHVLKESAADRAANLTTYNNPELALKKELVNALSTFILSKTNTPL